VNPFADYHLKPDGAEMGYKVEPGFNDLPYHTWWIKGESGGIHVWARTAECPGYPIEWIGGVEVHYANAPDGGWFDSTAPSQASCWLLDGPCWHDGSSLYFSERIAPRLPYPDDANCNDFDRMPHSLIGYTLVDWFLDKLTGAA
jgi:hypothetical protein